MRIWKFSFNRPQLAHCLAAVVLTTVIYGIVPVQAGEKAAPPPKATSDTTQSLTETIATVNGRVIIFAEVVAHAAAIMRPHDIALEDLIDLQLLTTAATDRKVKLPPLPWNPETRTSLEIAVARALGIEAAMPRTVLIVDHAWLRVGKSEKEHIAGRALIEQMRTLVAAGATIPQAFVDMSLDSNLWHIGDHEEYPFEVIPPEARDLAPGSISPVISGDGGLHLFRIYENRQRVRDQEQISAILRTQLRESAVIERLWQIKFW